MARAESSVIVLSFILVPETAGEREEHEETDDVCRCGGCCAGFAWRGADSLGAAFLGRRRRATREGRARLGLVNARYRSLRPARLG